MSTTPSYDLSNADPRGGIQMSDLLTGVLAAHGGLDHWSDVKTLTAKLSLGGPFWAARGWPGVYADQTVTLDAQREHITFAPFTAPDHISVLDVDPERVAILDAYGEIIEASDLTRTRQRGVSHGQRVETGAGNERPSGCQRGAQRASRARRDLG
jgi:hypothetical protein